MTVQSKECVYVYVYIYVRKHTEKRHTGKISTFLSRGELSGEGKNWMGI